MKTDKKYTLLGNLKYSLRLQVKHEGYGIYYYGAISIFTGVLQPFLSVLLPSIAVSLLTGQGHDPLNILCTLSAFVIGLQLMQLLSSYANQKVYQHTMLLRLDMDEYPKHVLSMDYEKLESPEGQKKMESAVRAFHSGNSVGIEGFIKQVPELIKNLLGLSVYSLVSGMVNPFILVYMLLSTAFVAYMNWRASQWDYKHRDERNHIYEKRTYLLDETIDSKNIKDIKLYDMKIWFMNVFDSLVKANERLNRKIRMKYLKAKGIDKMLSAIRDGVVYAYLIYKLMNNGIALDGFILMLGVIAGFGAWMNGVVEAVKELWRNSVIMSEYREFMDYGLEEKPEGGFHKVPNPGCPHEIKLQNVSYVYPGADKPSLKDISLTINKGEKLALVGVNGAGKSTLVKLIAGLYKPASGIITIDGVDISYLSREAYYKELAVIFQEVFAFAFPLDSNITGQIQDLQDSDRLELCLKQADIWEKVQQLPNKMRTAIMKDIDRNGAVFSGGEMQKLMLARALYKDAPIVILDEPTSALDPIAESNMYEKYNSFTKNKTSVFISHRLSSTRFCDRVIYMEDGVIAEEGTHQELIEINGKYAEMFDIQSHYYKENNNNLVQSEGDVCYE
jgi:ABC-type multidrug transport system fused ATPase/permease subunit